MAQGYNVGASLYEEDLVETARRLLDDASSYGCEIPLPVDVRVASEFSEHAQATVKSVEDVSDNDLILDVGPQTEKLLAQQLKKMQRQLCGMARLVFLSLKTLVRELRCFQRLLLKVMRFH